MGLNIAGFAINKSYKNDISKIEEEFGWDLEFEKEITVEDAMRNWKDEGIYDFYFTEHGTLIFTSFEECAAPLSLDDRNVLTFVLSEMSMTFVYGYYEGTTQKREVYITENGKESDDGEALPNEPEDNDWSDFIYKSIEKIIGEDLGEIDLDAKAYRYRTKGTIVQNSTEEELLDVEDTQYEGETELTKEELDEKLVMLKKTRSKLLIFSAAYLALFILLLSRQSTIGYIFAVLMLFFMGRNIFTLVKAMKYIKIIKQMLNK